MINSVLASALTTKQSVLGLALSHGGLHCFCGVFAGVADDDDDDDEDDDDDDDDDDADDDDATPSLASSSILLFDVRFFSSRNRCS